MELIDEMKKLQTNLWDKEQQDDQANTLCDIECLVDRARERAANDPEFARMWNKCGFTNEEGNKFVFGDDNEGAEPPVLSEEGNGGVVDGAVNGAVDGAVNGSVQSDGSEGQVCCSIS